MHAKKADCTFLYKDAGGASSELKCHRVKFGNWIPRGIHYDVGAKGLGLLTALQFTRQVITMTLAVSILVAVLVTPCSDVGPTSSGLETTEPVTQESSETTVRNAEQLKNWVFVSFERPEFPVAHTLSARNDARDSHKKLIRDLKRAGLVWLHSSLTGEGKVEEILILRTDDLAEVDLWLSSDSSVSGGFAEYRAYLLPRPIVENKFRTRTLLLN